MSRTYPRIRIEANGDKRVVGLVACSCIGIAIWQNNTWTPGSRGPTGGICGACAGAIKSYAELVHDMEAAQRMEGS